jgi:site-specific recombinase XerD
VVSGFSRTWARKILHGLLPTLHGSLGTPKRLSQQVMPHSFATHLLEDGYDIRTVQELLGYRDVRTTMIYLHMMNRGALGVKSPTDRL